MSVVVVTGENDFARLAELHKLTAAFVAVEGDLSLEQLDASDTEFVRIQEALTSLPFLANKKMVVIREPSKSKEFVEQAEVLLQSLPETTELVLHESKFDKRSGLYKLLKKQEDFREFSALDANALVRWAAAESKSQGASLGPNEARYLVERVGQNQQILSGEISKLSVAGGTIDRARIDTLTEATPQSTIFQLIDAALRGDTQYALELYDEQRIQKVEPQQIIAMFAWQLHVLALIKAAGQRSTEDIAKQAKLNPYVVGKAATLSSRLSLGEVRSRIDMLLEIDVRGKTQAYDLDDALKLFILNFVS
jgi:DNA polymerase-3 subunit delta